MPDSTCPVTGCHETALHEHRAYRYTILDDTHWYELRESEIRLLNELFATQGRPVLLFGSTKSAAEQLIWGPEAGIQPAPEVRANEV
jgi:hypothetical protein